MTGEPTPSAGRALAFGLTLALSVACAAEERPPNIVVLVSDDQDNEHFGFLGHPLAHTPTIDAMAGQGVVFTNAFVPMSRCRPAQASLMSGRWPHQSGVYFNVGSDHIDPTTAIAGRLADAGYLTRGAGKFWEHSPRQMGFTNETILNYETFAREGQGPLFRWIDAHAGEAPLFIWWAPQLPHVPHNPPDRLLALFDRDAITIPDWYEGDPDAYRRKEHESLAMEAWLDESIAELRTKLDEVGELERTLFLFLIDNGYSNGLPSKGTAFDKGLRTPVVLSGPGLGTGGRRFDELVSTVDLYATLLDVGGARIPEGTAGRSLRPLIDGESFEARSALFGAVYVQSPTEDLARAERDAYGLWARTPEHKYVLYLRDVREADDDVYKLQYNLCAYPERDRGDEDLFDLRTDPHELNDLSDDPALRADDGRPAPRAPWPGGARPEAASCACPEPAAGATLVPMGASRQKKELSPSLLALMAIAIVALAAAILAFFRPQAPPAEPPPVEQEPVDPFEGLPEER